LAGVAESSFQEELNLSYFSFNKKKTTDSTSNPRMMLQNE